MTIADSPLPPAVLDWLKGRHHGVLVTLRRDGSPQTSNIAYVFDGTFARISVTDSRAKTRNLRRNPHAVLHVIGDSFYQYVSMSAVATLSEVSTSAGDDTGRELLELHDAATGKAHPDPDEFFAAMVTDERLVIRLAPTSVAAMGVPPSP
jgi:PPOX class probable F420-dependent enzyme